MNEEEMERRSYKKNEKKEGIIKIEERSLLFFPSISFFF